MKQTGFESHGAEERGAVGTEADLENQRILRAGPVPDYTNITELELLKKRKGDLEEQLGQLQNSRRDLIVHLDELMQMLRVRFHSELIGMHNFHRLFYSIA